MTSRELFNLPPPEIPPPLVAIVVAFPPSLLHFDVLLPVVSFNNFDRRVVFGVIGIELDEVLFMPVPTLQLFLDVARAWLVFIWFSRVLLVLTGLVDPTMYLLLFNPGDLLRR